jgi:hypothetical protein
MTMRATKALFLSLALAFGTMSSANAASVADCISITSGEFKKGSFETTYEITVRNACGDSVKDLLNYTSLSFYAGSSVLNPETASIFYLPTYGQNFTFRMRNLKAGKYSPYVKIYSPKDYSSRTVYLPGFSITNPLDCVRVTSSEFFNSKFDPLLRVSLKNDCSDLDGNSFSGFQYTLDLPGYFSYLSSKSIYSLSSYGSSLDFSLRDIKPGSYSPSLLIKDSDYESKRVNLGSFFVSSKANPAPIPKKSSVSGRGASLTQVCATSKEFSEQCSDFPDFSFDFCSNLQNASLQEKVGSKWVFLWKVNGTKDSSICSDSKYPFHILATGENKTGTKSSLRLVFAKTSKLSSYTQNFNLVFR